MIRLKTKIIERTRNADYANHWFTWSRSKTVKFISGGETGILRSWDQVPVFLVWILNNHKVKYLDGRQHSSEPITSTAWTDFTWLASCNSVMMKQVSTEKYLTSRFPFSLQWINTRCADKQLYSPNILVYENIRVEIEEMLWSWEEILNPISTRLQLLEP